MQKHMLKNAFILSFIVVYISFCTRAKEVMGWNVEYLFKFSIFLKQFICKKAIKI